MAIFTFQNGARYTRHDVFRAMGMDPLPKGGWTVGGYFAYQGAHVIFCNVGVPGRTGHDYDNRFDGLDLLWTGKTDAKRSHPSIMAMTRPDAEVHIFFREDNSEPFVYIGLGIARSVDDAVPVGIRWAFEEPSDEAAAESEISSPLVTSMPEGMLKTVKVNKYERSAAARAQCIKHFGTACQVCGLDFGERYGRLGAGFIHVHHHVPLSEIGREYQVDPVRDLVPVCPNCHAMLHRGKGVKTLDAVRMLLAQHA